MKTSSTSIEPLVASIDETCAMLRLGRTKVHQLLTDGTLKSTKVGQRRLVTRASINALVESAS